MTYIWFGLIALFNGILTWIIQCQNHPCRKTIVVLYNL